MTILDPDFEYRNAKDMTPDALIGKTIARVEKNDDGWIRFWFTDGTGCITQLGLRDRRTKKYVPVVHLSLTRSLKEAP